ncbi:MAG: potassium transporter TrkA [Syntrophobacter sp. DG_60]|nr:MAG: potassium transporter TrkA [Syntrophobacter sp. DG_60]
MNIIIVGTGEVGYHLAERLSKDNDIVCIEENADKIRHISENLDVKTICGSGSDPATLQEADIGSADILTAVTDKDEINMVACLFANILSPKTIKIARIRNSELIKYREIFSKDLLTIDLMINPELEVVKTILRLVEAPGASDIVNFADGMVKLIGIKIYPTCPISDARLKNLEKKGLNQEILIAAIVRNDHLIIPSGEDKVMTGDLVYVVSKGDKVSQALALFGERGEPINKVLIIGGGRIGGILASELEKRDIQTKIIEKKQTRCAYLAEKLEKTVVLEGDGTDQTLLKEENVQDMDIVIPVTGQDDQNVLISLLARNLGTKKTLTLINKTSYLPLVSAIGLDITVSPALSAVSALLRYVRKEKVLSDMPLKGGYAEAIEIIATENSDVVKMPLRDLEFPKGAIIVAIVRNKDVIIPSGKSVIRAGDRIIIFSSTDTLPKVEKFWR